MHTLHKQGLIFKIKNIKYKKSKGKGNNMNKSYSKKYISFCLPVHHHVAMPTQKEFSNGFLWDGPPWPRSNINTHSFNCKGRKHKRPEHKAHKPFPLSSPSPNIPEFLAQFRMDRNNLCNLHFERLVQSSLL